MEDETGLTSSDFGKLLISSFAKIQAAQQIQANMLASIIAGSNPEKHDKLMTLYYEDVQKSSGQTYDQIIQWLNDQATRQG